MLFRSGAQARGAVPGCPQLRDGEAVELAAALNRQTHAATACLRQVADALGVDPRPAPEAVAVLGSAPLFEESLAVIERQAGAVSSRNERLNRAVARCAEALAFGPGATADLEAFVGRVQDTAARQRRCRKALAAVLTLVPEHEWTSDARRFEDAGSAVAAGALAALHSGLRQVNSRLAQCRTLGQKLAASEADTERLAAQLGNASDRLAAAGLLVRRQKAEIEFLKSRPKSVPTLSAGKLEGRVLQVSPQWGFAILDLGQQALGESEELLVARNGDLVGKVRVSKCLRDISVGEILSRPSLGAVRPGDRVIRPAVGPVAPTL